MGNFNDLEIEIADGGDDYYRIEFHLDFASSAARGKRVSARLKRTDFDRFDLLNANVNIKDYGTELTELILSQEEPARLVRSAIDESLRQRRKLRIRLYIDNDAKELQRIHWETLRDPSSGSGTWLLANESVLFSRDLGSSQLDEELLLRTREQLRALVVVANPNDIGAGKKYPDLEVIDVDGEIERAKQAMRELHPPDIFVSPKDSANGPFVTLSGLMDKLRTGADPGYDILYLVCHGKIVKGEPRIWLEADDGQSARISAIGDDGLVAKIRNLPPEKKPRLIVLASCESGGSVLSTDGALAALGPLLALEAHIPAVIAMGGSVTVPTIEKLMPRFFQQLAQHGQIDQALAAARGDVASEPDAWMPILYMRLKYGSVWSPGWAKQDSLDEFGCLEGLRDNIEHGTCVPILGPGLLDFFTGPRGSFSQRWAENEGVPHGITPTSLPQVAQYILTKEKDKRRVSRSFTRFVQKIICEEYGEFLPEDCRAAEIDQLLEQVAGLRRKHDEYQDAIYQLAKLPFQIYITTNPDTLLASSLNALRRPPHEVIYPWNHDRRMDVKLYPELYQLDEDYEPNSNEPLLYYLFGRLDYPETLVLTEDEHFDYLLGIYSQTGGFPNAIKRKVNRESLLFLGFSQDDWAFRVMLRSLLAPMEDKPTSEDRLLAASLVGADTRYEDYERMQGYLEQYFMARNIQIFWGNTFDFVRELAKTV
jgi:hypothetical protein